ncbi:hypothetical protein M405DRAFT_772707, partial [Rhizopogon salebrosus TDB-379]
MSNRLTSMAEQEEGIPSPPPQRSQSIHKPCRTRARNVVIFGESGSGKSSVVNAIAQQHLSETSGDAAECTSYYQRHEVEISGESFVLFDTVGLDEATTGPVSKAEKNLKILLQELVSTTDGIGLLVYCVRSTRVCHALIRNYKIFYSTICRKLKIPIVLVVTGLENYRPTMESWWDINWQQFQKHGMHFEDHACVTT